MTDNPNIDKPFRVTSLELQQLLKEISGDSTCEVCGSDQFTIYANNPNSDEVFMIAPSLRDQPWQNWPMYFYFCSNCGNTKMLAEHIVNEKIKRKREQQNQ